ncbi:unnamed protein product [Strongylus vulgaris]|uniref:Cystatin domain-containing protein n=1 Tax=Strongylus vulgaris TaxID=40348 RepID=A0A3P7J6C7_STRVU|nr:unnamed protein product [Strongylus vulgaris]
MVFLHFLVVLFAAAQGASGSDSIEATVISNQAYDPSMNDNHLQVFKNLLNDYIKTKKMSFKKNQVQEKVINVGGKFSLFYTLTNFDCNGFIDFAREGKSNARFVKTIKVKCGGKPETTIN